MSNLKALTYNQNEVRMIMQDDGPWWVLPDVCRGCTWTEKTERPGTASPLKMEYAPALPSPDAHQASVVSFLAGMHSTFPAVIRSPGSQSRASQMLRIVERVTMSWYL